MMGRRFGGRRESLGRCRHHSAEKFGEGQGREETRDDQKIPPKSFNFYPFAAYFTHHHGLVLLHIIYSVHTQCSVFLIE